MREVMNKDNDISLPKRAWNEDSLIKYARVGGTVMEGSTNPTVTKKEFVVTDDGRYFVQIVLSSAIVKRASQPVGVEEFLLLLDVGDYLISNGRTSMAGGFRYDKQPDGSWYTIVAWRS
jgi:hypothetical protein